MSEALGTSIIPIDRGIKELLAKTGLKVKRRGFGKSNCYSIPNWQDSSKMTSLEDAKLTTHESSEATTIIDNINKYNTKVDAKSHPL
ncbi:MAG: hypothetical protein ACUVTD_09120 [Nitrososphaerales archaeon]